MRTERVNQIAVVQSNDGQEFQTQFNELMARLSDCNPQVQFNFNQQGHCAYITYEQTLRTPDRVADEYHAQGVMFKCKQCPLHEVETDGRVKRVKCKYADLGYTHLENECCEVFYRRLNLGEVEPKGNPIEISKPSWSKTHYKEKVQRFQEERGIG